VAPFGQPREEGEGALDEGRDLAALLDVRAELQVLHHRHAGEDHVPALGLEARDQRLPGGIDDLDLRHGAAVYPRAADKSSDG